MTRGMTMNDFNKVRPSHTQRAAFVYIRQSSPAQVEYNRESTARQYALVEKACTLGWAPAGDLRRWGALGDVL